MTMKMLAWHAKFIFVFAKCMKHVGVHCTRDWVSETPKNLREHNIWSCSIINSIKLYQLINWVFCGRKVRAEKSYVNIFLGSPNSFQRYKPGLFSFLWYFIEFAVLLPFPFFYPEEPFIPALLYLVYFGHKMLKFLQGYLAEEATPR